MTADGVRRKSLAAALLIPIALVPLLLPIGIPPFDRLAPLPGQASLDYSSRFFGGFAELRDRFVALALGLPFPTVPARPPGGSPGQPGLTGAEGLPRIPTESIPALSNDRFTSAAVIGSVPYQAQTRTAGAGRERSEPRGCGALEPGGSVWFRFTPSRDIGLIANTFGSNYATVLAVYRGERLDRLESVGCDEDVAGNAIVAFAAGAGTPYVFQVASGVLSGGRLNFRLVPQGVTERVSVSSSGQDTDEQSSFPSISSDGRYIAYFSRATNIADRDAQACSHSVLRRPCNQIYLYDRASALTVVVSVSSSGEWANGPTGPPALAASGRFVAFSSSATNLAGGDTNVCPPPRPQTDADRLPACDDVFVRDVVAGTTEIISRSSAGRPANGYNGAPSISADGRYVAFESDAPLVDDDANVCAWTRPWFGLPDMIQRYSAGPCTDVYVRDRLTGAIERISVSSTDVQGDGPSWGPSISADGRYVAFSSSASNLVDADLDRCPNINPDSFGSSTMTCTQTYLHDRLTGRTELVSLNAAGEPGDGHSYLAATNTGNAVSSDGRYVLFFSQAHNIPTPGFGDPLRSQAFVRDMVAGTTVLVSASSNGEKADDIVSWNISMSRDGRYVVFPSSADNLVPGDTNAAIDVFLRDLITGTTVLVSVSSTGVAGDNESDEPAISADGRVVAFHSHATNLVEGDSNFCADDPVGLQPFNCPDIFVHTLPEP